MIVALVATLLLPILLTYAMLEGSPGASQSRVPTKTQAEAWTLRRQTAQSLVTKASRLMPASAMRRASCVLKSESWLTFVRKRRWLRRQDTRS